MIYGLVYNQPLRKNVIHVMFWYCDVTSWDMRWSLWRTRPFKIPSDHGHLLVSSIYLPKSSIVLLCSCFGWTAENFIAGLVIKKNIMGISTFKQSIPSVSTRKHAVSIPDCDKIPQEKGSLAPWIRPVFWDFGLDRRHQTRFVKIPTMVEHVLFVWRCFWVNPILAPWEGPWHRSKYSALAHVTYH